MTDPRIPLKNPWLAAGLGYLIPGAGHLYQGRTFKGVLYFVCILGTFFFGLFLGDWKSVYYQTNDPAKGTKRTYGFYAQVGVGIPAIIAYVQSKRYNHLENEETHQLLEPLSTPFEGRLFRPSSGSDEIAEEVVGHLELEPVPDSNGYEVQGKFTGTTLQNEPVEIDLGGSFSLGAKIGADSQRPLTCEVVDSSQQEIGKLEGGISRSWWNWFEVPVEQSVLEGLYGRMGKTFELALVFTWIAGLLNFLAVWDALDGPAYGYGDEHLAPDEEGQKQNTQKTDPSGTADVSPNATPDTGAKGPLKEPQVTGSAPTSSTTSSKS